MDKLKEDERLVVTRDNTHLSFSGRISFVRRRGEKEKKRGLIDMEDRFNVCMRKTHEMFSGSRRQLKGFQEDDKLHISSGPPSNTGCHRLK